MNKKNAMVSIVLIAMMSFALIPATKAFQTGPGSGPSDTRYETFGPRASQFIMNVYTDYASMFFAFHSKAIDFLDSNILSTDYASIAGDPSFTESPVIQFGLRQFDFNTIVPPFDNLYFRKGLNSLIDRNQWMSAYFPSGGLPAYSVLQSQGSWADPALGPPPYYPQDFAQAYLDFCLAYGAPIADPLRPGYSTWSFPNPYPTAASNPNPTPYPGSGPAVGQNQILFFIRTEQTERRDSGVYLVNEAENALPAWAQANQGNPVFATYPLPTSGGNKLWPALNFYNHGVLTTSATTSLQVMTYYRFQLYTGGWSTGSTPDFLEVWLSDYTAAAGAWSKNAYNYGSFSDTTFDTAEFNMETAIIIDPPTTYGTARYWAYQAQEEMMAQAAVIPWWIYAGYSATLTSTYDAISALGVGFDTWWSFFNAYPTSGSPGYATNSLIWGWQSDMHANANPISATWVWDWNLIGMIYDAMVSGNPYDTSQFHPGLASDYSVVLDPATTGWAHTVMTGHLREDVYWQDVPQKDRTAFTMDGGSELNGPFTNVPMTPLDVAFTYVMARDFGKIAAVHINPDAADVDHVAISPLWASQWPWTTPGVDPPWWNSTYATHIKPSASWDYNFVHFDPTLDQETIKIYLNDDLTWLAYYTDLSIPVFPLHIFRYLAEGGWSHNGHVVPDVFLMNLSPLGGGADLMYGTGPYIWLSGTPGQTYTMIAYQTGANYRGITEQNSYFWGPVRLADAESLGIGTQTGKELQDDSVYFKQGTNTLYMGYNITNFATVPVTFQITGLYDFLAWNGAAWVRDSHQAGTSTTATMTVTIPALTTQAVWLSTGPLTLDQSTTWIDIWEAYTLVVTSPSPWAGRHYQGGDYGFLGVKMLSDNSYYANRLTEMIQVKHYAGDIAGAAKVEPYYGSDHKVGISDVNPIAFNWGKTLSWTGLINPIDQIHQADINGDGKIGISDVNPVAFNWGKSWATSDTPPADPASPFL